MTVNEIAVSLRFANPSTAYQALSDLKHLSPATTEVRGAVLVERHEDGAVRVPEGMDTEEGRNTAVGGLVGSLVGILGGPLGVLMGWGVGALIGGGYDYKRAERAVEAVTAFIPYVPPGGTAILAEIGETDPIPLDRLAERYEAVLERRPVDSVRAELKAMEKAAERARKEEARQKRDRGHAERNAEKKAKEDAATPAHEPIA